MLKIGVERTIPHIIMGMAWACMKKEKSPLVRMSMMMLLSVLQKARTIIQFAMKAWVFVMNWDLGWKSIMMRLLKHIELVRLMELMRASLQSYELNEKVFGLKVEGVHSYVT